MDNAFRIKKFREPSKSKSQDIVSGTLDSVHQSIITSIKDSTLNIEELRKRVEELEDEIEKIIAAYVNLFQNQELRSELGENGKKLIQSKYQIEPVTNKIIEFIKHIS